MKTKKKPGAEAVDELQQIARDAASDKERARAHFEAGRLLAEQQKNDEAMAEFERGLLAAARRGAARHSGIASMPPLDRWDDGSGWW